MDAALNRLFATLLLGLLLGHSAYGQDAESPDVPAPAAQAVDEDDAIHNELRTLRDQLVEAINQGDLDRLTTMLDEKVVVVWMDGVQSRGPAQVREYYDSKTKGENAIVKTFTLDPKVTESSFLHGDDTAIAYGTAVSHFELTSGRKLEVAGPWSATMIRHNGQWLIASFHSSVDMFENPLLNFARRAMYWTTGIAAVAGLFLGMVVMGLLRRRRAV